MFVYYFATMSRARSKWYHSLWPENIQHIRASASVGLESFNFVALFSFSPSSVLLLFFRSEFLKANDANDHVLMVRNL